MALSFRDKQIILYEGGYIDVDYTDTANTTDINNLWEDFLEAAKTMDKEIEAGNFITVDKQFVMNNVGMFRGIHEPNELKVYVCNIEVDDAEKEEYSELSLVFDLGMPASYLKK